MKPITVVGGGLAGLSLGILLRQEKIPVTVVESGRYPRHRVCGEFLSGSGGDVLRELELHAEVMERGVAAHDSAFFVAGRPPVTLTLRRAAISISRYELDALLARRFEQLGGILKTGEQFSTDSPGEGTVRATGRRRAQNGAGHLFGLKAHASGAELSSDLEMHFGGGRYVGICRLPEGRANVCGLFFSREPIPNLRQNWQAVFQEAVNSPALRNARWDGDSFCAVSGLTMTTPPEEKDFCIGDAAAMIPPLTGNGMSMAFESASLAAPLLARYCSTKISWDECVREQWRSWHGHFGSRLRWAAFLQRVVFSSHTQGILYRLARLFPALANLFFSRTR